MDDPKQLSALLSELPNESSKSQRTSFSRPPPPREQREKARLVDRCNARLSNTEAVNDQRGTRRPFAGGIALLVGCIVLWLETPNTVFAGDAIATAGDVLQLVLPATAGGLTLGYRDWQGSLQLAESTALTLGVTYTLKYTVDERRPNGGTQSFPSGHTSISFSAAEFMRKRYGWEYGIPAYALAGFVAYSRVEAQEHHPHDVMVGAGIGIISSYIFTRPYKGWHFQLNADGKSYGFSVCRNW